MRSTQCTRLSAPKWMLTRLWLQCRQRRITIFAALCRAFLAWRRGAHSLEGAAMIGAAPVS